MWDKEVIEVCFDPECDECAELEAAQKRDGLRTAVFNSPYFCAAVISAHNKVLLPGEERSLAAEYYAGPWAVRLPSGINLAAAFQVNHERVFATAGGWMRRYTPWGCSEPSARPCRPWLAPYLEK